MAVDVTKVRKSDAPARAPVQEPERRRSLPWVVQLYRSALGKKYVMAITGVIGIGFVIGHMIGNFKFFLGAEQIDLYGEWLRESLGYPLLPHTWTLWLVRLTLIGALVLHVHAAYALTVENRRARPDAYRSRRDYVVADFAGRTMRWTGVIVLLFLVYHLADFTWGTAALPGEFERGAVYANLVSSFSVETVAVFYIVANVALGVHLYHGTWSMFQSLGLNNERFNRWRHHLAVALSVVIVLGFIVVPVAVMTGVCPGDPGAAMCPPA